MYIEMNIKVDGNTYRISKLEKFFGYWEFFKVTDTDRNLCEYMGSCKSAYLVDELSKILGEFSGSNDTTSEIFTLAGRTA